MKKMRKTSFKHWILLLFLLLFGSTEEVNKNKLKFTTTYKLALLWGESQMCLPKVRFK